MPRNGPGSKKLQPEDADAGAGAGADADGQTASHPRMALVHLLRSVAVDLDLQAAAFATEHGLHPTDVRALIALLDAERAGESMTPGRLGTRLHLKTPATTAVVDRLEALGLLTRAPDPHDRRRVQLSVSPKAKSLGWRFFGPLIWRIIQAMEAFDEADLDAYERVLRAIAESLPAV
jgi:DNA-binding MarR family transcriptional regulator